jgi:XTP/dITP diphosphohydrolase
MNDDSFVGDAEWPQGREIRSILGDEFDYLSLNDFPGAPNVVEDADSFAAMRRVKRFSSRNGFRAASLRRQNRADRRVTHILADDSGLEVDALNGAPGVHSARFAAIDSAGSQNLLTQRTTISCSVCLRTCPPANVAPDFGA